MLNRKLILILLFLQYLSIKAQRYSFVENKMGSPFQITISTRDTLGLQTNIKQCFALVDSLANIFSDYEEKSECTRLSLAPSKTWIEVSKPMFDLLVISKKAWDLSNKKFDITIGRMTKEWRQAKKEVREPNQKLLKEASKFIGCDKFKLDERRKRVYKKNNKFSFDFGGIAKGYISDKVVDRLKVLGYKSYIIDAGGDLLIGDPPVDDLSWKVALNNAMSEEIYKIFDLNNKALATSGATYQYLELGRDRYSHIIHPKKYRGDEKLNNVSVMSDIGCESDWVATAASIMSAKEITKLVKKMKDLSILILSPDGQEITWGSGFK